MPLGGVALTGIALIIVNSVLWRSYREGANKYAPPLAREAIAECDQAIRYGGQLVPAILFLLTILFLPTRMVSAQQPSDAQLRFFETNIRPALVKYCYDCHSVDAGDSRGGLLLDTRQGLLQGGDSGPAIKPGDHASSLIWEAINWIGYEMPPIQKMPSEVIAHFKTWIDMGAPDPRERELLEFKTKITLEDIENSKTHWAFQAPKKGNGDIDSIAYDINNKGEVVGISIELVGEFATNNRAVIWR